MFLDEETRSGFQHPRQHPLGQRREQTLEADAAVHLSASFRPEDDVDMQKVGIV